MIEQTEMYQVAVRDGGRPTDETTMLVCQCGSTKFREKRRTPRAVVFLCANCDARTTVNGCVAVARVPQDEIDFARTSKLITPDFAALASSENQQASGDDGAASAPKAEAAEIFSLRFSILVEDKPLVRRALEAVRVLNAEIPEYRAQNWQGKALALICSDFLAGVDPRALAIVDAQEQAIEDGAARAVEENRKWTKRNETKVRNAVREALAAKYGLGNPGQGELFAPQPDPVVEDAKAFEQQRAMEREADAARSTIRDDGYVRAAIIAARVELGAEGKIIIDTLEKVTSRACDHGGYCVKVLGDPRVVDKTGRQAVQYIHVPAEYEDDPTLGNILIHYLDAIDDVLPDASFEIVEIVPADFGWEIPAFATRRETERTEV